MTPLPARHIVINYGAPRTGTHFIRRATGSLKDAFPLKLEEGALLHPCQSEKGLIELAKMFRHNRLTIIRTVRHPLRIVESFLAIRWGAVPDFKGSLATWPDEKIAAYIRRESINTARQRALLKEPDWKHRGVTFCEVKYENFHDLPGLNQWAQWHLVFPGEDARRFASALEKFGKDPATPGQLSSASKTKLEDAGEARAEWWAHELEEVRIREGYPRDL